MKLSSFFNYPALTLRNLFLRSENNFLPKALQKKGFFHLSPCGRGRDQRERVRGILQFWRGEYLFGNA